MSISVISNRIFMVGLILIFVLWLSPFFFKKYAAVLFPFIPEEDIYHELVGSLSRNSTEENLVCPLISPHLRGMDKEVYKVIGGENPLTMKVHQQQLSQVQPGGVWKPLECRSRYEVCIILHTCNRYKLHEIWGFIFNKF